MNVQQHPRYVQCLWYGWGQQDAGIGHEVDVFEFALAHATQAVRSDEGKVSHLPSIQSAWKAYITEEGS
jgi:hypothetical protein